MCTIFRTIVVGSQSEKCMGHDREECLGCGGLASTRENHMSFKSGAPRMRWRHWCITSCDAGVSPPAKFQQRACERPCGSIGTRSHPTWPSKHNPISAGGLVARATLASANRRKNVDVFQDQQPQTSLASSTSQALAPRPTSSG